MTRGGFKERVFAHTDFTPVGDSYDLQVYAIYGEDPQKRNAIEIEAFEILDISDPGAGGMENYSRQVEVQGLSFPKRELKVVLFRPRVVRFVASAVPPVTPVHANREPFAKPTTPSSFAVLPHHWTLELEYTVLGHHHGLVLQPGDVEVQGHGSELGPPVTGSFTLDPAEHLPGKGGEYSLVAHTNFLDVDSRTARMVVAGIIHFEMDSTEPRSRRPFQKIDLRDKRKVVEIPAGQWLLGRAGTFRNGPNLPGFMVLKQKKHNNTYFGQIIGDLDPEVALRWHVVGPTDMQVELDIPRLADTQGSTKWDVSQETHKTGGEGRRALEAKRRISTETYFEADLNLWKAGVARRMMNRLTASVVRIRRDRPMPKIAANDLGFAVLESGERISDHADPTSNPQVKTWQDLDFSWKLEGDALFNILRLTIIDINEETDEARREAYPLPTDIKSLWQVDLKPRGEGDKSGTMAPSPLLSLAGAHGRDVVVVVELIRKPNAGEGGGPFLPSAVGAQGVRRQHLRLSGSGVTRGVPCVALGDACPVNKALTLRGKYIEALRDVEQYKAIHAEPLRAAQFVKKVAERLSDKETKGHMSVEKVYSNLAGSGGKGSAQQHGNSYLKEEITRMEGEIEAAELRARKAVKKLIAFISHKSFQDHLALPAHTEHVINEGADNAHLAETLYGVGAPASYDPGQLVFRQIDHYLVLLLDFMEVNEEGRAFLDSLLVDSHVRLKLPAFDKMWDYFGKFKGAAGPTGKLAFSILPALKMRARLWTNNELNVRFFGEGEIPSGKFKKGLDFIEGRLNKFITDPAKKVNLADAVVAKSWDMAGKHGELRADLEQRKLNATRASKYAESDKGKIAGVDGKFFGLMMDAVSFAISIQKLELDFKTKPLSSAVSMVNAFKDLIALSKSALELQEARLLSRASALPPSSTKAAKLTTRAQNFGKIAKVANVAVSVISALVSGYEAYKNITTGDWDRALIHGAAAIAALVSILFPGVGTVLGLVIAIIAECVLDSPIVDWLEDTPWGEHGVRSTMMQPEEVIDKYYAALYKAKIYMRSHVPHDSTHDALVVVSNALSASAPVVLNLRKQGQLPAANKKATIRLPDKSQGITAVCVLQIGRAHV